MVSSTSYQRNTSFSRLSQYGNARSVDPAVVVEFGSSVIRCGFAGEYLEGLLIFRFNSFQALMKILPFCFVFYSSNRRSLQ